MAATTNSELARIFEQMAAALQLLDADPFRVNAHAKAARVLWDLEEDVQTVARRGSGATDRAAAAANLMEIPGVGKATAEKILQYLEQGEVAEHRKLLADIPAGLFELLHIPGLGPKTIRALWQNLAITSLAQLKGKLDSEDLLKMPRMGRKTIDNIRKAIEFLEKGFNRAPLGVAHPVAVGIVEILRRVPGTTRVEFAGSLRRGKDTVGDLDLVACCKDDTACEAMRELFCTMLGVSQVLGRGDTKCSIRLEAKGLVLQADLRIVPEAEFGAAFLYFTGSKEHNIRLRERATRMGMQLNEYGLFPGTEARPQDRGLKPVASRTEEDVYRKLDLPWISPEIREDRGELDGPLPALIAVEDIKAELHAHTTASDGRLTIDELAAEAKRRGFHTIAVTDHSVSSTIAGGLSVDRLRRHIDAVREANERIKGITILAGSEVDILPDGRLDYDDETLALLDIVVASPHASLRQEPEAATKRLLRAIANPFVRILGHPTGRLIGSREGVSPDMPAIFAAAKEHDVALEINSNWMRLDLRDTHVRGAVERGCLIAIDTDAHTVNDFDHLPYGVTTARRGWVEPAQCINAWPAKKLHAWLASKRG